MRTYNRYISHKSCTSPSRKTAVKFLMTSPDNPLGPKDEEEDELAVHQNRFDSARRNTYGGSLVRAGEPSASPESGSKVTMYCQLQEEIKMEARRRSDLAYHGHSSFQFLLGDRSSSPGVSYFSFNKTDESVNPEKLRLR